jgi:hypothetical protein
LEGAAKSQFPGRNKGTWSTVGIVRRSERADPPRIIWRGGRPSGHSVHYTSLVTVNLSEEVDLSACRHGDRTDEAGLVLVGHVHRVQHGGAPPKSGHVQIKSQSLQDPPLGREPLEPLGGG